MHGSAFANPGWFGWQDRIDHHVRELASHYAFEHPAFTEERERSEFDPVVLHDRQREPWLSCRAFIRVVALVKPQTDGRRIEFERPRKRVAFLSTSAINPLRSPSAPGGTTTTIPVRGAGQRRVVQWRAAQASTKAQRRAERSRRGRPCVADGAGTVGVSFGAAVSLAPYGPV
jgi:hypothetical protein